jgi:hypothetical protein
MDNEIPTIIGFLIAFESRNAENKTPTRLSLLLLKMCFIVIRAFR